MPRKNKSRRNPQAYRRGKDAPPPLKRNPMLKVPLEQMVIPKGRCYFRSRKGKLRFTEAEVGKALEQARRSREARGLPPDTAAKRYYPCPEGGCGDYHLTSRTEWIERGQ